MSIRKILVSAVLLGAASAQAAPPPALTTEYSASRRIETDQGDFDGRVHAAPGKERNELHGGGMSTVMILREDRGLGWMLMPGQKMYQEVDFSQASKQSGSVASDQVDLEEVGTEMVSGLVATKYKFVSKDGGSGGFLWYTAEGIPVKMDVLSKSGRKKTRMTVTLHDVQVGPQDPAVFELPDGYKRMPGGLFGVKR